MSYPPAALPDVLPAALPDVLPPALPPALPACLLCLPLVVACCPLSAREGTLTSFKISFGLLLHTFTVECPFPLKWG